VSKIQSFLPYDSSTVANYLAWAQGIGNALSAFGWTKTTDQGQVNWADVTTVANGRPTIISQYNFGAWAGGTSYPVMSTTGSSVVTSAGLTYACIVATQYTIQTVVQNQVSSTLSTSVAAASSSNTVYTAAVAGATTNSLVGYLFVVTGDTVSSNNNGTFACVANTAASVTLSNPNGVSHTSGGTFPTLTSAATNIGYINTGSLNQAVGNSFVGLSMTTTSLSGSGNNTTFTVTASGYGTSTGDTVFCGTVSGTSETGQTGFATMNTAPAGDTAHWLPYNYEVWQSNDSLSATNPIFLRIVYASYLGAGNPAPYILVQIGGGQTSGTGYITGTNVANSGQEYPLASSPSAAAQGNVLFECDFSQYQGSFAMFLWRNGYATSASIPVFVAIDRAKDNFGNDLDAYEEILVAGSTSPFAAIDSYSQVIFKPGVSNPMPFMTGEWTTCTFGGPVAENSVSTANNGTVATFPIFPVVGYVANPCLSAVAMSQSDVANGAFLNVILYGTSHTYLFGYSNSWITPSANFSESSSAIGLRWD
jgi:hypothetical protein